MKERFIVDDAGSLIDLQTRDTFDYVSDVCELLNTLHNENKWLLEEVKEIRDVLLSWSQKDLTAKQLQVVIAIMQELNVKVNMND